jgi:phenylacetate-coenzyme A ligase PaaK-like adenylate-forming protein
MARITLLQGYALPLIRYEPGDYADRITSKDARKSSR